MALRSVVLAPPPGGAPRHTVVLRPGGPQDKGRKADLVTLIAGVILLLACVVLVQLLPHKDYLNPQFRVTFVDQRDELTYGTQHFQFKEGTADQKHDFTFDVPNETQSIQLVFGFKEDPNQDSTLKDSFQVQLLDPQGNQIGATDNIDSPPPLHDANATKSGEYTAQYLTHNPTFALVEHPADQVVPGLTHTELKEQVKARLAPQFHIPSAGTYTVRVTLLNAGDCEDAGPSSDFNRLAVCRSAIANGVDPGNDFDLNFVFTTILIDVQNLR